MSITSDASLIDETTTNTNTVNSSTSLSDPLFDKLLELDSKCESKEPAEQTNYEMEQVRFCTNNKSNIIKILQEQLDTLHRKHKETIDETESIKCKYNNALSELESVKKILAQYKNEIAKYETERKSTTTDKISDDDSVTDPNLRDIADKIADVQGKVKAVKQIVSDSDMPKNVQDDIDKVDSAYRSLLKQQYDRIEDILTEHSSKLDSIKARLCGGDDRLRSSGGSKIRFSLPNINSVLESRGERVSIGSMKDRPSFDLTKINLIATLRQTNEILEKEIEDLRNQMKYLQRCLRDGAEEFVEDVIEFAKISLEQPETDQISQRSEMKALHDMNNYLRHQNKELNESILQQDDSCQKAHKVKIVTHNVKGNKKATDHDILLVEQELVTMEMIIDDLKEETQTLKETVKQREDSIDELEADIQVLNTKIDELSLDHDSKAQKYKEVVSSNLRLSSERLDTLKQQIDQISLQKQDTEAILQKTVREKEGLTRNMDIMTKTMQQYKNELEVKQAECTKYKEHIRRLEQQVGNFDQQILEKDSQHEQQLAKNKNLITDIEGKYRNSKDEMERLKQTSEKLMALKGQNEKLVDEVEQLSLELERFKGFESKDQLEMDLQMQKLQCFCKKLEDKLEETRAEITHQDSKQKIQIKQHLNEKSLLENQANVLREEIIQQRESSKTLTNDIENYKDVIKNLTGNIEDMRKELNQCHRLEKNPHRFEDMLQEHERLKEEMRERNCEIANLRITLDDYNRCYPGSTVSGNNCQNNLTHSSGNPSQIPLCQESVCAMKQLRKLTDDMKNTQSKIASIVNGNQDYGLLQQFTCPNQQRRACDPASVVNKLCSLKDRVENMNQKEEELQYLLNALQQQNNKLIEFNHKRQRNDVEIETRLATIQHKKDAVEAVIKDYQDTQNDISRRSNVPGNKSNRKDGISQIKSDPQAKSQRKPKETAKSKAPSSISNDPLFHNYQNQLDEAVTKYKHMEGVEQTVDTGPKNQHNLDETNEELDDTTESSEEYDFSKRASVVPRTDSLDTTRSLLEKRKSLQAPVVSRVDPPSFSERSARVSIKIFHDEVVKNSDVCKFQLKSKSWPIPIFSNRLEVRRLEPLHFNAFYAKVPSMMFAQRQSNRLAILAEYKLGEPVLTGGPLRSNYRFWQMYFLWGNDDNCGSAHTVNDKRFIMEMHAVHIKEKLTEEQAMNDPEGFAILTYLYNYSNADDDELAMASVVQNFQRFDLRPDDDDLEFQSYFPLELLLRPFNSEYITYRGALPNGSDTENVIWIMAPFANKLSHQQMMELRELKSQVSCASSRPLKQVPNKVVILAEALEDSGGRTSLASNLFSQIYDL